MGWTIDPTWWASAVELPALGGLFWLFWRTRRDTEEDIETLRRGLQQAETRERDALAAFKLDVAQNYASITYIKDIEKRLTSHLDRIEQKLDAVQTVRAGGWE